MTVEYFMAFEQNMGLSMYRLLSIAAGLENQIQK